MVASGGGVGQSKEGSLLFLKKKKQKDFIRLRFRRLVGRTRRRGRQTNESFLVLFFKKEPLSYPSTSTSTTSAVSSAVMVRMSSPVMVAPSRVFTLVPFTVTLPVEGTR